MTKAPDTWMPLYIGDYLADTLHLTRDQHGAYLLIIMAYWRNSGPLPDDDDGLAAITKSHPNEWKKLRPVMTRFFRIDNEGWHHKRIDAAMILTAFLAYLALSLMAGMLIGHALGRWAQ